MDGSKGVWGGCSPHFSSLRDVSDMSRMRNYVQYELTSAAWFNNEGALKKKLHALMRVISFGNHYLQASTDRKNPGDESGGRV